MMAGADTCRPAVTTAVSSGHIPVLAAEIVDALAPGAGDIIVDATFGAGGYSRALLAAADCHVVALDRDPDAASRAARFASDVAPARFTFLPGCFGDLDTLLPAGGFDRVDGIVFDVGVSSFQLDEAERGFSFQSDGPLDMRMSRVGESAADIVNAYSEAELVALFREYGEEPKARRIAAAIVAERDGTPFSRTHQLADLVVRTVGQPRPRKGRKTVHPATRVFQALRILVNDELGELRRGLLAAEARLKTGGRLVVVSFHSLEDRIVKTFLAERAGRVPAGSRHRPPSLEAARPPSFDLKRKSAVKPTAAEVDANPRARSARLRAAVRTPAPAWGAKDGEGWS